MASLDDAMNHAAPTTYHASRMSENSRAKKSMYDAARWIERLFCGVVVLSPNVATRTLAIRKRATGDAALMMWMTPVTISHSVSGYRQSAPSWNAYTANPSAVNPHAYAMAKLIGGTTQSNTIRVGGASQIRCNVSLTDDDTVEWYASLLTTIGIAPFPPFPLEFCNRDFFFFFFFFFFFNLIIYFYFSFQFFFV